MFVTSDEVMLESLRIVQRSKVLPSGREIAEMAAWDLAQLQLEMDENFGEVLWVAADAEA